MDADQIHELMQDAAARPLRYLTGVFTEWQATNKPGYRVKVEAVLKEIEYAARLFGVTLAEKPPPLSPVDSRPVRQALSSSFDPGLWYKAPPGTTWGDAPTARDGKFDATMPSPWEVVGGSVGCWFGEFDGRQCLCFRDVDRKLAQELGHHNGPLAYRSTGRNVQLFVRRLDLVGESKEAPNSPTIYLGLPSALGDMEIFKAEPR